MFMGILYILICIISQFPSIFVLNRKFSKNIIHLTSQKTKELNCWCDKQKPF
jgi:hypothetical protein